MAHYRQLPFALRWLLPGIAFVCISLAGVALWVDVFGEPFGEWDWTIVSFVIAIGTTLALGSLAAANGPYEQRLRRWDAGDFAHDAYATQFRMDLAAAEQVKPRRLFVDSRFILLAIPSALVALALGIALAQSGNDADGLTIPELEALTIADEAIRLLSSRSSVLELTDSTRITVADAQSRFPDDADVLRLPADRQIYLVSYNYDDKTSDAANPRPGPVVLVDAGNGRVLAIVEPE